MGMTDPEANRAVIARCIIALEQGDDPTFRDLYAPDHVMRQH